MRVSPEIFELQTQICLLQIDVSLYSLKNPTNSYKPQGGGLPAQTVAKWQDPGQSLQQDEGYHAGMTKKTWTIDGFTQSIWKKTGGCLAASWATIWSTFGAPIDLPRQRPCRQLLVPRLRVLLQGNPAV